MHEKTIGILIRNRLHDIANANPTGRWADCTVGWMNPEAAKELLAHNPIDDKDLDPHSLTWLEYMGVHFSVLPLFGGRPAFDIYHVTDAYLP